jgi:hypothetical protein
VGVPADQARHPTPLCQVHQDIQHGVLDSAVQDRQLINHVSIRQAPASSRQMTTLIMPLSPKRSLKRTCRVWAAASCSCGDLGSVRRRVVS